jgi:class 3 adenylate cyclase
MPDAPASAAAASVLFLNVPGLAKRPAAEQARVKERLEALVERAIAPLAAPSRIVADQVDGIAVAALDSPADALQVARRARRLAARRGRDPLPLRVSLNHGPLRVAPDDHGELWLTGDAIAAGASIAGFAEPGRILASRSFRDALQPVDPERAAGLRPAGTFTDAALRAHELYAFEPSGPDLAPTLGNAGTRRRRLFLIGALGIAGLLAAGVAVRAARRAAARARR